MAGKAVASAPKVEVPDLVQTPALEITAEDVALPRIHIAQFSSKAVQAELVKAGTLFASTSQDDPDPQVLDQPVRFHVLAIRRGKSFSEGGELQRYEYNDPDAPANAWVTYDYTVALPDVDPSIPFKVLLTRTGMPAARQLNTILAKGQATQPAWSLAFELTITDRTNDKGKYWIPQVRQVDPTQDGTNVAAELASMMSSQAVDNLTTNEQPDI